MSSSSELFNAQLFPKASPINTPGTIYHPQSLIQNSLSTAQKCTKVPYLKKGPLSSARSAYNAAYVALAKQLQVTLYTLDEKLAGKAKI